jgi:hypothetical protein
MSEVKVNKISPRTGTTFTIGDAGDTISTAGNISANTVAATTLTVGGQSVTALQNPTITSINPSTIDNTQTAVQISGTNFQSIPFVDAINASTGAITQADSVSYTSSSSISATFTLTTDGTYYLRVENNDGLAVRSTTALLTVSDSPTWNTAAGSLGSLAAGGTASFTVSATSDSTIAYSIVSGALPGGLSLNSATGAITGTESGATAETAYNFTIRATDAEAQTADRAFSITVTVGITEGMQFN